MEVKIERQNVCVRLIHQINIRCQMILSCSRRKLLLLLGWFIFYDVIFSGEASNTLASITRLKSRLSHLIEPDFGLLDELLRLEVMTREEYDDVCSERTPAHRIEAVLDLLISENQFDKFLKALWLTDQQHIVNFVTENGGQR